MLNLWSELARAGLLLLGVVALLLPQVHADETSRYAESLQQMEELQRARWEIMNEEGREAFIRRCRAFIDAHPSFDKNIYLETDIAHAYETDVPGRNEPRDMPKAVETYLSIIERYDDSHPHMKQVKLFAGNRTADLYPEMSAGIYRRLVDEYPDDDALRLQCYEALGSNAWKRGAKEEAEEYFSLVLMYDATALPSSETTRPVRREIRRAQHNAAVGLWALTRHSGDQPPVVELAAVREMLRKYPQIGVWHCDTVNRRLDYLEKKVQEEEQRLFERVADDLLAENISQVAVPAPDTRDMRPADADEERPALDDNEHPSGEGSPALAVGGGSKAKYILWVGVVAVAASAIGVTVVLRRRHP